ncbi:MAG TPA: lipase secretion chaperone [Noviherbaspirillum sp.]
MRTLSVVGFAAAAAAAAFFAAAMLRGAPEEPVAPPAAPNLFPFVRSLEGTVPDGEVQSDPADRLVVSEDLMRLFEYYLVAIGEKSLDDIRRETERALDERLTPGAAREAKELLGRYLAYKQALADAEKHPQLAGSGLAAVRGRLDAIRQTRARFFSDMESAAMFATEDAMHADAIARLEISLDTSLSDSQKTERLAALDAALPASLREARDSALQIVRLEEQASRLRSQGASEDDVYRMRAAALSPEAAARMAEVDREESEWKQRIAAYLAERHRVLAASASQSPADREATLQQLRQAYFSADEQLRLPAYE